MFSNPDGTLLYGHRLASLQDTLEKHWRTFGLPSTFVAINKIAAAIRGWLVRRRSYRGENPFMNPFMQASNRYRFSSRARRNRTFGNVPLSLQNSNYHILGNACHSRHSWSCIHQLPWRSYISFRSLGFLSKLRPGTASYRLVYSQTQSFYQSSA